MQAFCYQNGTGHRSLPAKFHTSMAFINVQIIHIIRHAHARMHIIQISRRHRTIIASNCRCWHHLAVNNLQPHSDCLHTGKAWTYVHTLQLFSVLHFMCQQCAVPRMGLRRKPFLESRKLCTQPSRTGDTTRLALTCRAPCRRIWVRSKPMIAL